MKSSGQPKRAVNLSLDGALVDRARALTGNLSGQVEQAERLKGAARSWNDFGERQGSFADEFDALDALFTRVDD